LLKQPLNSELVYELIEFTITHRNGVQRANRDAMTTPPIVDLNSNVNTIIGIDQPTDDVLR